MTLCQTEQATGTVTLFSDRSHYQREHRGELADILRPYWKDAAFNEEERRQMYGLSLEDFQVVYDLTGAKLAVLPMTWNFYLAHNALGRARDFIDTARRSGRAVLSYVSGDEGVAVPAEFDDVYVVRPSGFGSRKNRRQIAQPVFFDDPLKRYPEFEFYNRQNSGKPMVGFCGQASVSWTKLAVDVLRGACRTIQCRLGARQEEAQPLYPSAYLRAKAMRVLTESSLLQTNFITRDRYRGGAVDEWTREQTTREFHNNIAENDYTLCVRGGGNFSKRFYETLAMGRIPVLVDTDCLLPFETEIQWDDYIVRVSSSDLRSLPEKIANHFETHGSTALVECKKKCRELWCDWLSFANYHRRVTRLILAEA